LLLGIVIALIIAEFGSRLLLPISLDACLGEDGKPVIVMADKYHFVSNLVFRQISEEFDAVTHITAEGHRAPAVNGKPDLVFVGNSFCFGTGVTDESTFSSIYSEETGIRCANLGFPRTGTIGQLDILHHYLIRHDWRPGKVVLCMTVSTGSLLYGNDLASNLFEDSRQANSPNHPSVLFVNSPWETRLRVAWFLRHFHLARVAKYYLYPIFRLKLSAWKDEDRMHKALEITRHQIGRFRDLGREYGFSCKIVVLHPAYDLDHRTDAATTDTIKSLASDIPVIDTADALRDTKTSFFARNGHFTPLGHRRVAEVLAEAL